MSDKCEIDGGKIIEPYNCILNLANIENNNNKFYNMQIVESNGVHYFCTRYGRTGKAGNINRQEMSLDGAIIAFEAKFRTQTGLKWDDRNKEVQPNPKKYTYMRIHGKVKDSNFIDLNLKIETDNEAKLPQKVATFLSPICSKKLIEEGMVQKLEIDITKMPLGNIDKSQLDRAEVILKELQLIISTSNPYLRTVEQTQRLSQLSSSYWTLIPKASKMNQPLPLIRDIATIQSLADHLNDLRNIQVASATLGRCNSLLKIYEDMKIQLLPLESGEKRMLDYMCTTSSRMHGFRVEMVNGMRIKKNPLREADKEKLFKKTGNHMYLFHGSISANWMGILTTGLRIPTKEQVSNGAILGEGAYFANCITKSANYCRMYNDETGYILIAEVAVGTSLKCLGPDSSILDTKRYQSKLGMGRSTPEIIEHKGILYPYDEPKTRTPMPQSSFANDEFVIYDSRQYRMRYLIQVKKTIFTN